MNDLNNAASAKEINVEVELNAPCSQRLMTVNALHSVYVGPNSLPTGTYFTRKGSDLYIKGKPKQRGFYVCLVKVDGTWPSTEVYDVIVTVSVL